MRNVLKTVKSAAEVSFTVSQYLCVVLIVLISGVMFIQVLLRYVFNSPLMWAESLVKMLLITVSFLGAGMAVKLRAHMFISLIWERYPPQVQYVMQLIFDVLILAFFVLFSIFGYKAALATPGFLWEFGNLPKKWLVMILPATGILICIQAFYLVLEDLFGSKEKEQ